MLEALKKIHGIYLCPNLFSIEDDILTPTFKIKRQQARDKFKDNIDQLYNEVGEN